MTTPKKTVIHLYFSEDHINEVDKFILDNKSKDKNIDGRKFSRNDYFMEAAAAHAKKLGLKTDPRFKKADKE